MDFNPFSLIESSFWFDTTDLGWSTVYKYMYYKKNKIFFFIYYSIFLLRFLTSQSTRFQS